jgi:ribosomal protein S18 acetylase RimI-like enzyme
MTAEPDLETPSVEIRSADAADAAAIAALHAASWQAHYRGSLTERYLNGPILAERLEVWTDRLSHPRPNQQTRLAMVGSRLAGFVCWFVDDDPHYGTLIDNLHVAVAWKGRGIGRRLMRATGLALREDTPGRPAYLYVLEANTAAQGFYDRIGGCVAERTRHTEPDGSDNPVLRYLWPTPDALVAGTRAPDERDNLS